MGILRLKRLEDRVYRHRARWTARRVRPFIQPGERVLDVGAGDCRLAELLRRKAGCEVACVDVGDCNKTSLPLKLYDGRRLPFADRSFDVLLLIFVLHHSEDPQAVLHEARRVCRRHVIAFEDVNLTWWDRVMFRGFHRWAEWSQRLQRPYHEWSPERWSILAQESGFHEHWRGLVGRQLGLLAPRHIAFVWDKEARGAA